MGPFKMGHYIAILGAGSRNEEHTRKIAFDLGKALALEKQTVICGGLGGVFEAAFWGAKAGNGNALAILNEKPDDYEGPCSTLISTGSDLIKRAVIAETCDAGIMIGGWMGSVSLFTLIASKSKKVIAINGTGGAADKFSNQHIIDETGYRVQGCNTVKEALALLLPS